MLSGENPPPDPPNLTDRAYDIDLPTRNKPPLVELDPGIHHRPNFSLRDYVFTARSKDIKNNWPFSLKNLHLCLKHGVKDPLPPFQPLEAVRNQPLNRCLVEKQNTYKVQLDGEPSGSRSNRHVAAELCHDAGLNHHDKAVGSVGNSGCEYENDQFLSTTTSLCQSSEIDPVPISKSSSGSAPLEAAGPCLKPQKPAAKKSRLIVKFGVTSDHSSAEDFTTPSESMASKVCPVCKTFSSSSNTTLNAHIDQCLYSESTPKWTAESKLSRHRIKPRKVKLMVDIYATAKRCTLEELDRRNGTSWAAAAASSLAPNQDREMMGTSDVGNDPRTAWLSKPESSDDVGAVYIDASGTKLRILSKSTDAMLAVSKSGDYLGPKKSLRGAKASNLLSNKRKRLHGMKHQKYLKLALQSRKFFFHNGLTSKMVGSQEEHNEVIQDHFRSEDHHVRKKILSSNFSSLRERAHMKRSCNRRKANDQDAHRPLSWKQHSSPDMQVQNDLSRSDDPFVEMNYVQKFKKLPQSTFSSHENCQRIKKPHCEGQPNDQRAHSSWKRLRSPLVVSGAHDKVGSFLPTKKNAGGPAQGSHMLKPLKSQSSSKKVSIAAINYSGTQRTGNSTPASETLKCLSSKKHVLSSTSRLPMVGSRSNLVKNYSAKMKMDVHIPEDDRAVAWHSKLGEQQFELTDDDDDDDDDDDAEDQCERDQTTEELSSGRGSIRGVTERGAALSVSDREGTDVSSSSPSASHGYSLEDIRITDSCPRNMVDIIETAKSIEFGERTATSLNKSVETKFQKMSNPCLSRSNTLPTTNVYNGRIYGGRLASMDDSRFVDKQQMFCDEEIAPGLIGQSARIGADMDSETVEGNSFPEVDPIPIPGPPGSFLPSPRDMGSEDFQGNSSLTTSRVQSSQEQFDLVDGDSSDSPLSAVSTISDPMALGSTRKHVEPPSSACSSEVEEKNRSGFSSAGNEQSTEDSGLKNDEGERILFGENFKVTRIPTERRPFIFRNDNQPCCCQRRERISQGLSLNFQESQLLRRRTVAPAAPSHIDVQVLGDQNVRPSNLDLMPGVFPFGSSPSYGSENSSITRPSGPPLNGFSDGVSKFAGPTDRDSASPSSSNPVLRLMGKNLVVNKEDASLPLGTPHQSHVQADHGTSQPPTSSGVSPGTNRNQDGRFLQHAVSQGSLVYGQNPHILAGQSFDPRSLNGFRNHGDLATPQTLVRLSAGMLPERCVDRGFISPAVSVKLEGNCDTSIRNSRLKNKKGQVPSFGMEKLTNIYHRYRNADAAVPPKQIIVIDDAPDNETCNTSAAGRHGEGLRENRMISSGTSAATFPAHGVIRHANSSSYQSQESLPLGMPPGFQATDFNVILPSRANASPAKWGCSVEGSGMLQKNQYVAASPSTSHLRSVPYYSPSSS